MLKSKIKARIEAMREIDHRVSEIADEDPLEALFILKNIKKEEGIDEKPLMAKIMLKLAEKLDFAARQNYAEKAKIYKSLIIKLIEELDVKDIYDVVGESYERHLPESRDFQEELIEDAPLEECISIFKKMK